MSYQRVVSLVAGACGIAFLGYCVYFDHKRRSDPDFKRKLKEKREKKKQKEKEASASTFKAGLPDLKDQQAVQQFFLEQVQKGEDLLALGDHENCVHHLTNAIAVCGQPQQLLQVFQGTLPPNVFGMLLKKLEELGSTPQKSTAAPDAEGLD